MKPDFLQSELQEKKKFYLSNIRSTCTNCNGEGMLINDDHRTYVDCPVCVGKFEKVKKYLDANISTEYLFLGLPEVKKVYSKECYDAFEGLVKKINSIVPKYGMLFTRFQDEYSYGVTTAGTILVKVFVRLNVECYIVNQTDLIDTFFSFAGEDKDIAAKRAKMGEYLTNVQCLMIDNFGAENVKKDSFANNKFMALLNSRKINNKITLICTDLSKDQLMAKYDDGIVKFLSMNYLNFQIKGGDGKYQRQASVKFENEFPDIPTLTEYIKTPSKPKQVPKEEKPSDDTKAPLDEDFDRTVDLIANDQPNSYKKRGKFNAKNPNRES